MHFAIVRESDLSILGMYEAEVAGPVSSGLVASAVHPSLVGTPIKAVRGPSGIAIVAEPPYPTFEEKRAALLKRFDEETKAFILARYQIERQTSFILLLTTALFEGKMNRGAYVQQAIEYVNSVLAYHFGINAQIEAAQTEEELNAITWDLDSMVASDPVVSIETALGIPD